MAYYTSNEALSVIQDGLAQLMAQNKVVKQGKRHFICCPYHGERTPSLLINVEGNYAGTFKCMGCGESGGWNKLARVLGLKLIGKHMTEGTVFIEHDAQRYRALETDSSNYTNYNAVLTSMKLTKPRKLTHAWRTLHHEFLERVGAVLCSDNYDEDYLFLPATLRGDVVGGIRATLQNVKDKRIVKYKNSPGNWSASYGLYPYDFAALQMDNFERHFKHRAVVLVEGARDSLCLNRFKIPTLGLLGTQSWTREKMELLLDLDPDYVLICMDGDSAGEKAELKLYEDLRKFVPCDKMNLSRFNAKAGYDVDPGNAPDYVITAIKQSIVRKNAV